MSVQLMESAVSVALGVVDDQVGARMTQRLPGGIPASVAVEAGAALLGMFGQKVGLGADVRDPLLIGALTLAGKRASALARAGTLLHGPGAWAVGGEGGVAAAPPPQVRGRNWAPAVRRLGQGGVGTDLYPGYAFEQGGVAS